MPFHMFVAGELEIIITAKVQNRERKARLAILKVMCYHHEYLGFDVVKDYNLKFVFKT